MTVHWGGFLLALIFLSAPRAHGQLFPTLGGQRAGISALQFLKIGAGARGVGMAESFIAVTNDATALHYNPAALLQSKRPQVHFSHTEWLVDLNHEFAGVVYPVTGDDAVGLSFTALHTPAMEITTETQPFGTGRYFTYSDFAVGLTYCRQLTDQFSFGATVKYAEETIDVLKMRAVLVDLGTLYWTGLGSLRFAVTMTNFGSQVSPDGTAELLDGRSVTSFQEYSPPTLFKIGFAFEPYQDEMHRITTSMQLNHPNDNSENVGLGVEYAWRNILALRTGYKINVDEETFSGGAGVRIPLSFAEANFDYAFADFGRLGGVHRLSITLGL